MLDWSPGSHIIALTHFNWNCKDDCEIEKLVIYIYVFVKPLNKLLQLLENVVVCMEEFCFSLFSLEVWVGLYTNPPPPLHCSALTCIYYTPWSVSKLFPVVRSIIMKTFAETFWGFVLKLVGVMSLHNTRQFFCCWADESVSVCYRDGNSSRACLVLWEDITLPSCNKLEEKYTKNLCSSWCSLL